MGWQSHLGLSRAVKNNTCSNIEKMRIAGAVTVIDTMNTMRTSRTEYSCSNGEVVDDSCSGGRLWH